MEKPQHKRSAFSGKIGFGVVCGRRIRGPWKHLALPLSGRKRRRRHFPLIYIILAFTFGYTMIVAETAIGHTTRKSPVGCFSQALARAKPVRRRMDQRHHPHPDRALLLGHWRLGHQVLGGVFPGAQPHPGSGRVFLRIYCQRYSAKVRFVAFTLFTLFDDLRAGVRNGVERVSRFMMPVLVVLSVVIAGYSITRPGALEGVKYFLVPNPKNFSWMTVVTAMGQTFDSLSIAMGILVTFGSYMKSDISIEESTQNVEFFDTAIAVMAGLMIIPAVFAFSGGRLRHP